MGFYDSGFTVLRSKKMINQPSPLESLAAFAIAFASGVVSAVALKAYLGWVQKPCGSLKRCYAWS
jgi:hypothetical protein